MRKVLIILIIGIFFSTSVIANDEYLFVKDYIEAFSGLDKATNEYKFTLKNESDIIVLKNVIVDFNQELDVSINKFSSYTNSESLLLQKIASDLIYLQSELKKLNDDHLSFLKKSNIKIEKLLIKNESVLSEFSAISSNFEVLAIAVRMLLFKPGPEGDTDNLYSTLTEKERDLLNHEFNGKLNVSLSVCSENSCVCSNQYEHALRLVYVFINLKDWVFEND